MSRASTDGQRRRSGKRTGCCSWLCVALLVGSLRAYGQGLTTPLHIGALEPIRDEFGAVLQGNALMNDTQRDRLQVLWASNSVAYPSGLDGSPDPRNPPVVGGESGIGMLTSPALAQPGRFGLSVADPRPADGRKMFCRAFNARTPAEASFYADSQVLTVSGNDVLIATFGATTNAIDPRDTDGDGLNNSWEKSIGSHTNLWDTDGDGVSDGDEYRVGTDPLDPGSLFIITRVASAGDGSVEVGWAAVNGMTYQVECASQDLVSGCAYEPCSAVITADSSFVSALLAGRLTNDRLGVRVRFVPK